MFRNGRESNKIGWTTTVKEIQPLFQRAIVLVNSYDEGRKTVEVKSMHTNLKTLEN